MVCEARYVNKISTEVDFCRVKKEEKTYKIVTRKMFQRKFYIIKKRVDKEFLFYDFSMVLRFFFRNDKTVNCLFFSQIKIKLQRNVNYGARKIKGHFKIKYLTV